MSWAHAGDKRWGTDLDILERAAAAATSSRLVMPLGKICALARNAGTTLDELRRGGRLNRHPAQIDVARVLVAAGYSLAWTGRFLRHDPSTLSDWSRAYDLRRSA